MVRADEVVARRHICFRCGQWTEYGTSMIDKCAGSDFQGRVGRKDPLHEWRTVVRLHVVNNDMKLRRRVAAATVCTVGAKQLTAACVSRQCE